MALTAKARVFMNGRSQHVTIPAEFRFSTTEVYIDRDAQSGVISLSERPLRPSLDEIYRALDAAGAVDFDLERNLSMPVEREWM
jgi:virulence-associated protein VagC